LRFQLQLHGKSRKAGRENGREERGEAQVDKADAGPKRKGECQALRTTFGGSCLNTENASNCKSIRQITIAHQHRQQQQQQQPLPPSMLSSKVISLSYYSSYAQRHSSFSFL